MRLYNKNNNSINHINNNNKIIINTYMNNLIILLLNTVWTLKINMDNTNKSIKLNQLEFFVHYNESQEQF